MQCNPVTRFFVDGRSDNSPWSASRPAQQPWLAPYRHGRLRIRSSPERAVSVEISRMLPHRIRKPASTEFRACSRNTATPVSHLACPCPAWRGKACTFGPRESRLRRAYRRPCGSRDTRAPSRDAVCGKRVPVVGQVRSQPLELPTQRPHCEGPWNSPG